MTEIVFDDAGSLAAGIAARLTERLGAIQAEGRTPRLVLTGGTIAIAAYTEIAGPGVDWSDVEVWWGDERFVPEGHADRNDRQAREAFLDRLGVGRVHPMPAHDCAWSAAEAADRYAEALPETPFDVVLLGMGPDGHVASLFPGFEAQLGETTRRVVEVFDSPKPPPVRLSLTFPALNHTRATWLLVSGEGKAEAVSRALAATGSVLDTPARGVHGIDETLWLLDRAAAGSSVPRAEE